MEKTLRVEDLKTLGNPGDLLPKPNAISCCAGAPIPVTATRVVEPTLQGKTVVVREEQVKAVLDLRRVLQHR